MTPTLRIALSVLLFIYFLVVIVLLKKKKLSLKYTLLWLLVGIFLLLMVIFPQILIWISQVLGIASAMNALFVCTIGFAFVLLLALTSIASRQSEKIKNLTQDNALLEKRIREIEKDHSIGDSSHDENAD